MSSAEPGLHHPLRRHRLLPPGPHLLENGNKSRNLSVSLVSSNIILPLLDDLFVQTSSTCQRQKSSIKRSEIWSNIRGDNYQREKSEQWRGGSLLYQQEKQIHLGREHSNVQKTKQHRPESQPIRLPQDAWTESCGRERADEGESF